MKNVKILSLPGKRLEFLRLLGVANEGKNCIAGVGAEFLGKSELQMTSQISMAERVKNGETYTDTTATSNDVGRHCAGRWYAMAWLTKSVGHSPSIPGSIECSVCHIWKTYSETLAGTEGSKESH